MKVADWETSKQSATFNSNKTLVWFSFQQNTELMLIDLLHFQHTWIGLYCNVYSYNCFTQVCELFRSVRRHYHDKEVDWMLVHDAGCTCDDTELPHHVSGPRALEASVRGPFRHFLEALPLPPTAITISRSSKDDYCPPEQVEDIQAMVLLQLKDVFNVDSPILHYLMDDDD